MQVVAGQVYLLYVSNWTQTSIGFDMDWILENGASLDCTVLPIELMYFEADPVPQGVALKWSTASETNNDRFEVERSLDGENFDPIGTVPGAGNSITAQQYQFLDENPIMGINYYRLQQVDDDGHTEYSPVRAVHFKHTGNTVHLLPNPGINYIGLHSAMGLVAGSEFVLLDATGRILLNKKLKLDLLRIDTSAIPPGLYAYRITSPYGAVLGTGTWVKE